MTMKFNTENTKALTRAITLIKNTFGDKMFTRGEYEEMRKKFFEENPQFTSQFYHYGYWHMITNKNVLPCWTTLMKSNILTDHGKIYEANPTHIWVSYSEYTLDSASILMPIETWDILPDEAKDAIEEIYNDDYKFLIKGFATEAETRKSKSKFYSLKDDAMFNNLVGNLEIATKLLEEAQEALEKYFA